MTTNNIPSIGKLMQNNYFFSKIREVTDMMDADSFKAVVDLGYGVRFKHPKGYRIVGIDGPELHSKDPIEREAAAISASVVEQRLVTLVSTGNLYLVSKSLDVYGRWLADLYTIRTEITPGKTTVTEEDVVPSDFTSLLIRDRVVRAYDGKKARTSWVKSDLEFIIMNYGPKA